MPTIGSLLECRLKVHAGACKNPSTFGGRGELNPAEGSYLNEFRIHQGVDTSYMKFNRKPDPVNDNPFDKIVPPDDLPYVGWTKPAEWFNLTVDVAKSGQYAADFLYTSNRADNISGCEWKGRDRTSADHNNERCCRPVRLASMAPLESGLFRLQAGPQTNCNL
jgi:hypothetical protein